MPARFVHARTLASSREYSEDRAEVFERGDSLVLVVADGAGGLRGGAEASDALVAAVRAAVLDTSLDVRNVGAWARILTGVDDALAAKMTGETTGVIVVLGADGVVGVSAGDSEAWIISATAIVDLTHDQEKRRLGSGRARPVTFRRAGLNGTLLVGTDGLFKYAPSDKIAGIVRDHRPQETCRGLVELVNLPSGRLPDDVGLVVCASA